MKWPETPMCERRPETKWVPGGEHTPALICSFCGCLHPEATLAALEDPSVRVEVADLKYGWPHKVYIDEIPDPRGEVEVFVGATPVRDEAQVAELAGITYEDERMILTALRYGIEVDPRMLPTDTGRKIYAACRGDDSVSDTLKAIAQRVRDRVHLPTTTYVPFRSVPTYAKKTTYRGKWYTMHLKWGGMDQEAFDALTGALQRRTGVLFYFEGESLKYRI